MDASVRKLVQLALEEDCANGDITSELCIDPSQQAQGTLIAKEPGIFCGNLLIPVIMDSFAHYAGKVRVEFQKVMEDGTPFKAGDQLAVLKGATISLLTIERTVLNFIQRLCGVATLTHQFVSVAGKNTILDTRKSVPGHRALDKYAVRIGGGKNHRMNLSDMILIKNNHIDGVGQDFARLAVVLAGRKHPYVPIEVEVRNQQELDSALSSLSPDVIMLDNYRDEEIFKAVKQIRGHNPNIKIELSGSMTVERVKKLSSSLEGVFFSSGALFTKVQNIDISMRIVPQ